MSIPLLITGSSGYLGQRLAALAAERVPGAAGTVNRIRDLGLPIPVWPLQLGDPAAVKALLERLKPAVIIHTAALTPAAGSAMTDAALWPVNVHGSAAIARWAAANGARLVHVSSDAIWGGREEAYSEEDLPAPITPYGASKAAAEAVVMALYPGAAIARTSLIYGHSPPDPNTVMAQEMAAGLRPGVLFTDEYRCPIFVDDLAQALLELGERQDSGVFHLVGPEALSRHELGSALVRWAGGDPAAIPAGTTAASGLRRPSRVVLSAARAQGLKTPLRSVATVVEQEVYGGPKPQSITEPGGRSPA